RHFIRQPQLLIFSTIQPVMFVLMFVYVFGGAVRGSLPRGVSYVDFLLPGILVQSVAFRATQTAIGLAEDLERGVVDRFRSMPMSRSAVLLGRTLADLVRNVLILGLMIVIGYLIGFNFHGGALQAIASVAVVAAFGFALSWIFAFVALTVRGAGAAQAAVPAGSGWARPQTLPRQRAVGCLSVELDCAPAVPRRDRPVRAVGIAQRLKLARARHRDLPREAIAAAHAEVAGGPDVEATYL